MLITSYKPLAVVSIGDEHIGGSHSLTERPLNIRQEWIRERFAEAYAWALNELAPRYRLRVLFGGDTVHLPGNDEWRAEAERLLRPWVDLAEGDAWGVPGTPFHVGIDGAEDRAIYRGLGLGPGRVKQVHFLRCDGEVLNWAHHGASVSKRPHLSANGLVSMATDAAIRALQYGDRPPSAIIRHHAHASPYGGPVKVAGVWAGVTGCWALPDDFAAKVAAGIRPAIGILVWKPGEGVMQEHNYVMPLDVIYA